MNPEMIVLRLIHIGGGVFWVGFAVFNAFFLLPAAAEAGPAGGQVMAALMRRKLLTIIPVVAIVMMLAGLRMLWIVSEGFAASYFATSVGMAHATGTTLAIVGFLIGMLVTRTSMGRVMALMQQRGPASDDEKQRIDVEVGRFRQRATTSGMISSLMLAAAALVMAVARYV